MSDTPKLLIPAFGPLYRSLAPVTAPLVRAISGLSLAAHGYPMLFGSTEANVAFFEKAGFHPALFWVVLAGVTQFAGGLCLAAGLFTRAVSVPILVFLLTAVAYHWQFGFYWNKLGVEYPLFWSAVTLHFLVHGGGRWSLDARLGRGI